MLAADNSCRSKVAGAIRNLHALRLPTHVDRAFRRSYRGNVGHGPWDSHGLLVSGTFTSNSIFGQLLRRAADLAQERQPARVLADGVEQGFRDDFGRCPRSPLLDRLLQPLRTRLRTRRARLARRRCSTGVFGAGCCSTHSIAASDSACAPGHGRPAGLHRTGTSSASSSISASAPQHRACRTARPPYHCVRLPRSGSTAAPRMAVDAPSQRRAFAEASRG